MAKQYRATSPRDINDLWPLPKIPSSITRYFGSIIISPLELERVQEQYDETKQELDLMKEEISSGGGGNVDNVRIKQLEMQTNQLKEAVVK